MDISAITSGQTSVPVQGAHGRGHRGMQAKIETAVAGALKMSVDDLRTQLASGKSLTDIAASKGVSKDALVSTISDTLAANQPGASSASSSTASSSSTGSSDLTALATRIADRVGGHHRHGTSVSATAASTVAAPQTGTAGSGGDQDGDGSTSANVDLRL